MKTRFWSSDWFAGLVITIVVVVISGTAPFQGLERAFYDWGVRSTERSPSDKIAVIAIDDQSIETTPEPQAIVNPYFQPANQAESAHLAAVRE